MHDVELFGTRARIAASSATGDGSAFGWRARRPVGGNNTEPAMPNRPIRGLLHDQVTSELACPRWAGWKDVP
ncbi:hypothetical protein, partial [Mycobacteroides abscessus]